MRSEEVSPRQAVGSTRLVQIAGGVVAATLLLIMVPWASAGASTWQTLSVAPWGSDGAAGTLESPYRTLTHAMQQLEPGDTLVVRDGIYDERVLLSASMVTGGTADAPITVKAAAGERPVIRGLLKLSGADYWTVRGINVTWSDGNASNEHMVQFRGGHHWRFTDAEVWGARSYSAINVFYGATDFRLDNLYVHHTYATNNVNQDHLIYIANDNQRGVIERNVLAHSPNGRGIKIGAGSLSEPSSDDLIIRYNTFFDNQGPSNIRLSGDSSRNQMYRNIMVQPKSGLASITGHYLDGPDNVASENLSWASDGVVDTGDGVIDGGGNIVADPQFADPANGDFRPLNSEAFGYGAHASSEESTGTATQESTEPTTTTTTTTTTMAPEPIADAEEFTLDIAGYKVKGVNHAELTWSGAQGPSVDVYESGVKIATADNDGTFVHDMGSRGSDGYDYQVCESGTTTCAGRITSVV